MSAAQDSGQVNISAEHQDRTPGSGHPEQEPVLRFVGGHPTPEEIAAVTAVVVCAATETEEASTTGARRAQNRRARLGLRLRPGLGAWRRTLPFR